MYRNRGRPQGGEPTASRIFGITPEGQPAQPLALARPPPPVSNGPVPITVRGGTLSPLPGAPARPASAQQAVKSDAPLGSALLLPALPPLVPPGAAKPPPRMAFEDVEGGAGGEPVAAPVAPNEYVVEDGGVVLV